MAVAVVAGCAAPAGETGAPCPGKCDGATSGETIPTVAPATLRANLLANLLAQMEQPTVMFGQQRFNLTGVNADGTQWLASDGNVDRSDAKSVTGQHPIVMGFDAWDLAIKPATWTPTPAVHAAAAHHVSDSGGIVTIDWHMRGCQATDSFNAQGNEACLCKLANDDAYARSWLVDGNLQKFADALVAKGLDRVPIIFRPLHELSGNWFWWGQAYWNCSAYVANPQVTGAAAYQKIYRTIVTYLRHERGLDNLLFAFAPDRFGDSVASDVSRYLVGYPGDAYVDVMGIDLYYRGQPSFTAETQTFKTYLATVASAAYAHGKAAALTEVGNTLLATDSSPWFTTQLLPLLANSHMAYALTWENRRNAAQEFWVPYPGHAAAGDFQQFEASAQTLFQADAPAFDQPPQAGYPMCQTCTSDGDHDGWGWEQSASCRVGSWCL